MRQGTRRRLAALAGAGLLAAGLPLLRGATAVPTAVAALHAAAARAARHAAGPASVPPALPAGLTRQVVRWAQDGVARQYVEIAPAGQTGPLPLVVVLHGWRQTPWVAERIQGWDAQARAHHLLLAYGAGYAGSWNAGNCCGLAAAHGIDDMAYLDGLLRRAQSRHPVDPRRIYLVGFSNGGMLAYRYACSHAELLAGIAVVAAALAVPDCRPSRPVAVLDVQGAADRTVPSAGSAFSQVLHAPTRSVAASLLPWRRRDVGTPGLVRLVSLPHLAHTWPTRADGGYDAAPAIWSFLAGHPAGPPPRAATAGAA